jgi:hypothetical protein
MGFDRIGDRVRSVLKRRLRAAKKHLGAQP